MPKWVLPVVGGGASSPCTFSLTPASFSSTSSPPLLQSGGSITVAVAVSPAGCAPQTWTASSNSSFINVAPTSGSGAGSVTVTVAANTPDLGIVSRNGSATIAGISFPVTGQPNAVTVTGTVAASEADGSAGFPAFPGVTVVAGQRLVITASGLITVGTLGGASVGPAGSNTGSGGAQARLPGVPRHGLICGINGQAIPDLFFVGTGVTLAPAAVGGVLRCGMNAPDGLGYVGNTGAWSVTVTVGG
jgi:hypothetical protein